MNKLAVKRTKQRSAGKPDIEMGKRIRLRRVEQRISQAELGQKLGVSFQQVQKYEKGVNRVGAARLQQIAGSRKPVVPRQRIQPPVAASLQQDQGPDRAAAAGVLDGIDRRRGLAACDAGRLRSRAADAST